MKIVSVYIMQMDNIRRKFFYIVCKFESGYFCEGAVGVENAGPQNIWVYMPFRANADNLGLALRRPRACDMAFPAVADCL